MTDTVPVPGAARNTLSQQSMHTPDWVERLALDLAENLELIEHPSNHNQLPARVKTLGMFLQSAYR
jgi:hypothetical protein